MGLSRQAKLVMGISVLQNRALKRQAQKGAKILLTDTDFFASVRKSGTCIVPL